MDKCVFINLLYFFRKSINWRVPRKSQAYLREKKSLFFLIIWVNNIGKSQFYENRSDVQHGLVTFSFISFVTSEAKIDTEVYQSDLLKYISAECRVKMSKILQKKMLSVYSKPMDRDISIWTSNVVLGRNI